MKEELDMSGLEKSILELQYAALRAEIQDRQNRRSALFIGSIVGTAGLVPFGLSGHSFVFLMLPLILIAVTYLFVIEVSGIKRAATFIETQYENVIFGSNNTKGWENWLTGLRNTQGDEKSTGRFHSKSTRMLEDASKCFQLTIAAFYVADILIVLFYQPVFDSFWLRILVALFYVFLGKWAYSNILKYAVYSAEIYKQKFSSQPE